jgi:hypothetical protein
LWFQAVERAFGLDAAVSLDRQAWEQFAPIEARRILERLGRGPGGGIPLLVDALSLRLYAFINRQEVVEATETRCVFRMNTCRVQETRKRKGLPDFHCKEVGLVDYDAFACTLDPRIRTRCIACPPDPHPESFWCAWEFTLNP